MAADSIAYDRSLVGDCAVFGGLREVILNEGGFRVADGSDIRDPEPDLSDFLLHLFSNILRSSALSNSLVIFLKMCLYSSKYV